MDRFLTSILLRACPFLLALLAPGLAAQAGPMPFEATLAIHSGVAPPIFFFGAGSAAVGVVGQRVDALTLPAGVFATQAVATLSGVPIQVEAESGAGSFSATTGGAWGGSMPILGTLRICLAGSCNTALPLDVVGAGGTTATSRGAFQVMGAPWQTGLLTLSGPGFVSFFSGYQEGPAGLASSTGLPGGFLLFVTPARVTIPGVGPVDVVAELAITLALEPGALSALGVALVLLALGCREWSGRRRLR